MFGVSLHDWDQSSTDSKFVDAFEQYWKKLLGQEDAHLKSYLFVVLIIVTWYNPNQAHFHDGFKGSPLLHSFESETSNECSGLREAVKNYLSDFFR